MSAKTITIATIGIALAVLTPAVATAGSFSIQVGTRHGGVAFSTWDTYADPWTTAAYDVSFERDLAGYGEWVWVDGLGQVWRPWVQAEWRPYSNGRWVWTEVGWTWVAYEPWGYYPHHFGEWALTAYGWAWVPGSVYRPANVVWVTSGSYVGWYACAPRGWSHSHRGYRHGYRRGYDDGYDDGWRDAQYANFVGWNDVTAENVARRAVPASRVDVSAAATRTVAAPKPVEVRNRGGREVPTVGLDRRTVEIDGRQVAIAKPSGLDESVNRHSRATAERVLAPEVATAFAAKPRPERAAAPTTRATAERKPAATTRTAPVAASERPVPAERVKPQVDDRRRSQAPSAQGREAQPAPRQQDERSAARPVASLPATTDRARASEPSRQPASTAKPVPRQQRESAAARPVAGRPATTDRARASEAARQPAGTAKPAPRQQRPAVAPQATPRQVKPPSQGQPALRQANAKPAPQATPSQAKPRQGKPAQAAREREQHGTSGR